MKLTKVDEETGESISFDNILNELDSTVSAKEVGNFEFKAITMKQQRKIASGAFDPVEIPAKYANIYNNFISENVKVKNEIVDATAFITLETKPYVLAALRTVSLGNVYYDDESAKEYIMREPTAEDMTPKIADETIEFGNIKIVLSVPTLQRDTRYNQLLCDALDPFKKKKSIANDELAILDVYQLYEIFKYISTVSFKGVDYDFDKVAMNDKQKLVNALHASIVKRITDYILKVEEVKEKALSAVNAETGDTVMPNIYTMFFAKSSQKG